jgi:hypothetical protein
MRTMVKISRYCIFQNIFQSENLNHTVLFPLEHTSKRQRSQLAIDTNKTTDDHTAMRNNQFIFNIFYNDC